MHCVVYSASKSCRGPVTIMACDKSTIYVETLILKRRTSRHARSRLLQPL